MQAGEGRAAARCMDVFGAVRSRCQSKQFVSAATEKAAAESLSAGPGGAQATLVLIKLGWFFRQNMPAAAAVRGPVALCRVRFGPAGRTPLS